VKLIDRLVKEAKDKNEKKISDTIWSIISVCESLYSVCKIINRAEKYNPWKNIEQISTSFAQRHGNLCQVAVREAMISALSRVPALCRAFCSGATWFPEFCEHSLALADAVRMLNFREDNVINDMSITLSLHIWHGNIYRIKRETFSDH